MIESLSLNIDRYYLVFQLIVLINRKAPVMAYCLFILQQLLLMQMQDIILSLTDPRERVIDKGHHREGCVQMRQYATKLPLYRNYAENRENVMK